MYKVFINETPLIFINSDQIPPEWKNDDSILISKYLGKKKFLMNYIDLMEKSRRYQKVVIFHSDTNEIWHDFTSLFKPIEAAGGVVSNEKNEILVIFRLNFWDLPKGKIDKGETPEQAAIREVQEETGLVNVTLGKHLMDTYHTYQMKGKRILKKTYWYEMHTTDTQLTPQYEEDIERADWVVLTDFLKNKPVIYASILEVLSTLK
jgi:mutator protein MutT